ncbi:MAG: hypothetical protein LBR25_00400 [Erysipelotrichaceae bacterium]|jgi:predicted membrane protein|nr:hypothetical protein [Erysipelotrichaceae bacterium]
MRSKNLIWGMMFVVLAGLILLQSMGIGPSINPWTLVFTFFLVPMLFYSIRGGQIFGIVFSLGILYALYDNYLPAPFNQISTWNMILISLLLAIGLSLIFRKRKSWVSVGGYHSGVDGDYIKSKVEDKLRDKFVNTTTMEDLEGESVYGSVSFGDALKYVYSQSLEEAHFDCSLGAMKLFLDNAKLKDDQATLHLECSLGSIIVYVPMSWRIINNLSVVLGEGDTGNDHVTGDAPTLIVTGSVNLGSIKFVRV